MLKDKIIIEGVSKCPICGHTPFMQQNASKKFSMYCPYCDFCGFWGRKAEAINSWKERTQDVKDLDPIVRTEMRLRFMEALNNAKR